MLPIVSHLIESIRARVFYGWWIVILGSLINAVGAGILYHSFTVFFLPLKRDFGVTSAAISLLCGASRLEGGFEGPIVGHLIDKLGPRVMILAGVVMTGLGFILLSTVQSFWSFFFVYIFVVSLGFNAGFSHPISTAVNNWFIRHRGVGFSCINASMSIGGMILAPFLSYLILNFGWRIGAISAGLMILIVGIPAALPIYRSPELIGLRPDGKTLPEDQPDGSRAILSRVADVDSSVKDALRTHTYWMLLVTISLRLFVTIALNAHFIPILVWRDIGEATGAYLVGLFAFASIFATLRGIMGVGYGAATFLSPIYAGWVFDKTESYNLVLITFAVILFVSSFLFALLGRPSLSKRRESSTG